MSTIVYAMYKLRFVDAVLNAKYNDIKETMPLVKYKQAQIIIIITI